MSIEQIVPKIISIFVKLIIYLLLIFLLLNLVSCAVNYPRLVAVSKMVQESARKHGFIPYEDYKNIQTYINAYTYQAKNVDSPFNINKVVTNLKMVVYDTSGNGYPERGSLHTYDYTSGETYYIEDASGVDYKKERKLQQGNILFAGISCDYLIIHPLNGWMLFNFVNSDDSNTITTDRIERETSGDTFDTSVDYNGNIIYGDNSTTRNLGYTTFNTLDILNQNDTTNNLVASLFIEPVITTTYYPDKEYSGTLLTGP